MNNTLQQLIASMPSMNLALSHPQLIADTTWLDLTHSAKGKKVVYIFRSLRHELLVAENGIVTAGEWDYYPNTHSISIQHSDKSFLYNALLVDGNYLLLKQDAYKEGVLLINQAYFIELLAAHGSQAMQAIFKQLKALAGQEWPSTPAAQEPPKQEEKAEAPPSPPKDAVAAEKPLNTPKPEEAVETAAAETAKKEAPTQEEDTSELLKKYRTYSQEEEDEDEQPALFNMPKRSTLNDRLKEQVQQKGQPTLLDQLTKQQQDKE